MCTVMKASSSFLDIAKKWDIHEAKGGEIEYKQIVIHLR